MRVPSKKIRADFEPEVVYNGKRNGNKMNDNACGSGQRFFMGGTGNVTTQPFKEQTSRKTGSESH
jgi:hypothetical protein